MLVVSCLGLAKEAKTKQDSRGEGRRRDQSLSSIARVTAKLSPSIAKTEDPFEASGDGGSEDLIFR